MWEWTLNWNQIRDDLVIGSCPMTTEDIDRIRIETGATALLSLQSDACRMHFGIDYLEHRPPGERPAPPMGGRPLMGGAFSRPGTVAGP